MELLDVYDDDGKKTGKFVENGVKDDCFNDGEHIAVAIIYIENDNNEFLIQKTSKQKGSRYSSTSGKIRHDEEPIEAIKREVKEELGIDISKDNIINLGHIVVDFPVRFIFYMRKNVNINDLVLQKDEVESVSYMNINELKKVIEQGLMHKAHTKILERVLKYKKLEKLITNNEELESNIKTLNKKIRR